MSPEPDLVVISGDTADSALPEEYEHARTLLGALQIPFAVIPGKHDRRTLMRKIFPDPSYGPGATLAWLESTLTANPTRSSTRASCIPTRPGYVMRTRWR